MANNSTTPDRKGWAITGPVDRLRAWGSDASEDLASLDDGDHLIGSAVGCKIRLDDAKVSRSHAALTRDGATWLVRDLESTNGIRIDGERVLTVELTPGQELGVGPFRLIAESESLRRLTGLLQRFLGFDARAVVDSAMRAVRFMATQRSSLVFRGDEDQLAVARRIHVEAVGDGAPFVVASRKTAFLSSLAAAMGGTICIDASDTPDEWASLLPSLRDHRADMRVVVCAARDAEADAVVASLGETFMVNVPSIASRGVEVARIVHAAVEDATAGLDGKPLGGLTSKDWGVLGAREWADFGQIDKTALRLVALRSWGSTVGGRRIGISHVSMIRWAQKQGFDG